MPEVVDDRRAVLEAAFADEEVKLEAADPPLDNEPPKEPLPTEEGEPPKEPLPTEEAKPPVETKVELSDKAPQSWRAPQREKWAKLDPDIRAEVMRRERETTKVLGETAEARAVHKQFTESVAPYQARIASLGIDSMTAVRELLKTDHILSTAPPAARAKAMAKIIADYGVDINELDAALAGTTPADPIGAQVDALLAQRLAPFQQYLTMQQQREVAQERASSEQIGASVETMSTDPKYPHFEAVRMDMADIVEISAKRGVYLSLDQAYTRAIAMNPEVSAQVATQKAVEAKKAAAQTANARAQRALNASVSVGGAPEGVPDGASAATDRRSVIAAAFDSVSSGR